MTLALSIATVSNAAFVFADSYSPANSHVTQIASDQMFKQNAVIFKLDQGTSDCAAGSYISYPTTNLDQLKLLYATVLAAYVTSSPLIVHFPTTGSCAADGIGIGAY